MNIIEILIVAIAAISIYYFGQKNAEKNAFRFYYPRIEDLNVLNSFLEEECRRLKNELNVEGE